MPRATNSPARRARRNEVLKMAKGFRNWRSTHYRYAVDAVRHAMKNMFIGRKLRRRNMRALWIQRINAGCRAIGLTYSRMIEGLAHAKIAIDRKILADLAYNDIAAFNAIAEKAKAALGEKAKKA